MSLVSKLALAAAFSLGATAITATPALAQKKNDKKEQAGPQLKISAEFRKVAAEAEAAVTAKDWAKADASVTASEGVAKNEDEKYYASFLRLRTELGRGNEDGQMKALADLIANPKTPAENKKLYSAAYYYSMGIRASNAKNYPEAIDLLNKARDNGSTDVDIPILLANAYSSTNRPAESVAEVTRAIEASKAAGRKPPEAWYQFAIPRVNQLGDRAAVVDWLTKFINEYPTVKNWHWAVAVFAGNGTTRTEKLDVFRLKRATNALPSQADYADYAYAAQQSGLPWEAVSVIEEGRKAGKIPASDPDTSKTFAASSVQVKNEGSLEGLVKAAQASANGKAAAQTGDAFLASGNSARAVELYDIAITKGGVNAEEVNLHRGIAYQYLGQKDQARTAFGLVKTGPLANLASLFAASLDLPPLS